MTVLQVIVWVAWAALLALLAMYAGTVVAEWLDRRNAAWRQRSRVVSDAETLTRTAAGGQCPTGSRCRFCYPADAGR